MTVTLLWLTWPFQEVLHLAPLKVLSATGKPQKDYVQSRKKEEEQLALKVDTASESAWVKTLVVNLQSFCLPSAVFLVSMGQTWIP